MDDEYYGFTLEKSQITDGLRLASIETLICLKAKAFLDLIERKTNEKSVDEKHIKKHKNDVMRLAVLLNEENQIELPGSIKNDMRQFMETVEKETIDFKSLGKNLGIPKLDGESVIYQIKQTFSL